MFRRAPRSNRTCTLVPYATRLRSEVERWLDGGPAHDVEVGEGEGEGAGGRRGRHRRDAVGERGPQAEAAVVRSVGERGEGHVPAGEDACQVGGGHVAERSEEHTSELQSLMRISYAVFCLKKK